MKKEGNGNKLPFPVSWVRGKDTEPTEPAQQRERRFEMPASIIKPVNVDDDFSMTEASSIDRDQGFEASILPPEWTAAAQNSSSSAPEWIAFPTESLFSPPPPPEPKGDHHRNRRSTSTSSQGQQRLSEKSQASARDKVRYSMHLQESMLADPAKGKLKSDEVSLQGSLYSLSSGSALSNLGASESSLYSGPRDKVRYNLQKQESWGDSTLGKLKGDDISLQGSLYSACSASVRSTPGAYAAGQDGVAYRPPSKHSTSDSESIASSTTPHPVSPSLPQAKPIEASLVDDLKAEVERNVREKLLVNAAQATVISSFAAQMTGISIVPVSSSRKSYKKKGVKERLFGDLRKSKGKIVDISAAPHRCIKKRRHLPSKVETCNGGKSWLVTVQTNQRAVESGSSLDLERGERHFAAPTEHEAYELASAMAVPHMDSYEENPICFLCKTKFALFRPSKHCRNCGVVICSTCSATWPSTMLPETFNVKKDSTATVCGACDWSAKSFKSAILEGKARLAVDLYRYGNVNLRTLYTIEKNEEAMYPIHMAVLGGSMKFLAWLVERRCCPLEDPTAPDNRLVTSRGRSPLNLAYGSLTLLQYLVGERKVDLTKERNLHYDTLVSHLSTVLKKQAIHDLAKKTRWNKRRSSRTCGSSVGDASSMAEV